VLGPNINAPMAEADEARALEFVHKAEALKPKASLRERAYIDALAKRYTGKAADRKSADAAFAEAMRALSKKYPADLDAATLFAESLMTLRPWDYWARDGSPYPGTEEIVTALERVLQRHPKHPGALHLYIHAVESTKSPERAEQAADTLIKLMPGAGHMVHMPSHIYIRVGRYDDAADSNELAVAADEDYITQCRAQGLYPMAYYPHNLHFLWWAATFEGRREASLSAAVKTSSRIPVEQLRELPFLQGFHVVPQYALVQFGMWDEILRAPAPASDSPFVQGIWRYARGRALVGRNRLDEAARELAELRQIVSSEALRNMPASFSANTALNILRVAPEVLAGELAARQKNYEAAVNHLSKAVRLEDALIYTEPADWPFPARANLGAVLLEAGRAEEAEVVFWEDLRSRPENGWSLFGVAQALRAQGKNDQAAAVDARFQKAWQRADTKLTAARF
jgi:tetratricopeptide (TPR) repeat protein